MNPFQLDEDEEGGGVGEDEAQQLRNFKDATIFVVDCGARMHIKPKRTTKMEVDAGAANGEEEEEKVLTPFQLSLQFVSRIMRSKVMSQTKDRIEVLFYDCALKNSNNNNNNSSNSGEEQQVAAGGVDFPAVYLYKSLDQPFAARIQEIEADIAEDKFAGSSLGGEETEANGLSNALWQCNSLLAAANLKKYDLQRIFIFTNNENPNPSEDNGIFTNAGDLASANRLVHVMVLAPQEKFNVSKFFQPLLVRQQLILDEFRKVTRSESIISGSSSNSGTIGSASQEQIETALSEFLDYIDPATTSAEDMHDIVRQKAHTKRRLANFPLVFGNEADGVEIHVSLYSAIMESKLPTPVQLEAETAQPVKVRTRFMCEDSATFLTPDLILSKQVFGGEKIFVKKEQMATFKNFGTPALRVLGFRSMENIQPYYNMKQPYFLFPDESQVKGSTRGFAALVSQMFDMGKVAIASMITKRNSPPRICGLWPQRELKIDNEVVRPCGMWVVVFPFRDDIRQPSAPEPLQVASEEQVEAAKSLIRGLEIKDPDFLFSMENPLLQKHWATLEAMALNEKNVQWDEEKDDLLTIPKNLLESEAVRELSDNFLATLGNMEVTAPKKRAAPGATTSRSRKTKADDEGSEAPAAEVDVSGIHLGNVVKHTMPILKVYCGKFKLPKKGNKQDLVDRVEEHLRSLGATAVEDDIPEPPRKAKKIKKKEVIDLDDD